MSMENARAFVEQLDRDKQLQEKVKRHIRAGEHLKEIAEDLHGLSFTPEELDGALTEKWGSELFGNVGPKVTFSEAPGF